MRVEAVCDSEIIVNQYALDLDAKWGLKDNSRETGNC